MEYGKLYKKLVGKTIKDIYNSLPIENFNKLMVDDIGIYNPKEHEKRYGDRYVHNFGIWDTNVLYLEIHVTY